MGRKFFPGDSQIILKKDLPDRNREHVRQCLDYLSDFQDLELSIRMNDKVKTAVPESKRVKQVIVIYATDQGIRIGTNLNDAGTAQFLADALQVILTTGSHDFETGTLKENVKCYKI